MSIKNKDKKYYQIAFVVLISVLLVSSIGFAYLIGARLRTTGHVEVRSSPFNSFYVHVHKTPYRLETRTLVGDRFYVIHSRMTFDAGTIHPSNFYNITIFLKNLNYSLTYEWVLSFGLSNDYSDWSIALVRPTSDYGVAPEVASYTPMMGNEEVLSQYFNSYSNVFYAQPQTHTLLRANDTYTRHNSLVHVPYFVSSAIGVTNRKIDVLILFSVEAFVGKSTWELYAVSRTNHALPYFTDTTDKKYYCSYDVTFYDFDGWGMVDWGTALVNTTAYVDMEPLFLMSTKDISAYAKATDLVRNGHSSDKIPVENIYWDVFYGNVHNNGSFVSGQYVSIANFTAKTFDIVVINGQALVTHSVYEIHIRLSVFIPPSTPPGNYYNYFYLQVTV